MCKLVSGLIGVSTVVISAAFLSGCGREDSTGSENVGKASSAPSVNAQGMTEEGARLQKEFEESNKSLRVEFSAPSLSANEDYIDIQSKLSAIQIYTAKRNWEESAEEIAKSIDGSRLVESALPELFQLEQKLKATDNVFDKQELAEKIASLVKDEAKKIDGNIRVKILANADLKGYDFESHVFASGSCLYSEKLEYSKDEMRNPNAFANAPKPRCYIQPSTTNFLVGIVNGSKLNLKVDDIEAAKKIENSRDSAQFEIYGYIAAVERERVGGRPGDIRHLLIDPQKVNVIDKASGTILYTQTF